MKHSLHASPVWRRVHEQQRPPLPTTARCCRCAASPRRLDAPRAAASSAPAPAQIHLSGACYDDIVAQLADRAVQAADRQLPGRRLMIGIAGAPGSGFYAAPRKSTLAALASQRINLLAGAGAGAGLRAGAAAAPGGPPELCIVLPMDGFHLYRSQLDAMPNRQEAYARRGCPWTFNAEAFVSCVRRAVDQAQVPAPSFDHGRGDPVEGDLHIQPHHRIVLVEGNYVLLDTEPWCELRQLFDDTWFVDVDLDVAMERVFQRQTSLDLDPEVSRGRIAGNDRPNGELVNRSKQYAAVLVPSSVPLGSRGHQKAV